MTRLFSVRHNLNAGLSLLRREGLISTSLSLMNYFNWYPKFIVHNRWKFERFPNDQYTPQIAYVPIDKIQYRDRFPFPDWGRQAIVGEGRGGWDWCKRPLETAPIYQSHSQYFLHGKEWEDTYLYSKAKKEIEREGSYRGLSKLSAVKRRYDTLYENIQTEGYKSQLELYQEQLARDTKKGSEKIKKEFNLKVNRFRLPSEVFVAISRDGELIRTQGGLNRLSIAKILDIDQKIPVIIQLTHAKWDGTADFEIQPLSTDHPLVVIDG